MSNTNDPFVVNDYATGHSTLLGQLIGYSVLCVLILMGILLVLLCIYV
jgi:hypothetical protein